MSSVRSEAEKTALQNATSNFVEGAKFPEMVFSRKWDQHFFLESDCFFSDTFVSLLNKFRAVDPFERVCLFNISRKDSAEKCDLYFSPQDTTLNYREILQEGGASSGWFYDMEQYICTSDSPYWAVYFERWNDLGVISVAKTQNVGEIIDIIKKFGGVNIGNVDDNHDVSIFGAPDGDFRAGLLKNYY